MLELVIYVLAFIIPATYLSYRHFTRPAPIVIPAEDPKKPLKTMMQPPKGDLAPPKDDPFTTDQLKEHDGSNTENPIYVAIKGLF